MKKLFIVVRADLAPGAQLAQSCHALSAFASLHPKMHDAWNVGDQNLAVLQIADEAALGALLRQAAELQIERADFYAPEFANELTACAFAGDVAKLVASLPLALRTGRAA